MSAVGVGEAGFWSLGLSEKVVGFAVSPPFPDTQELEHDGASG